jgi:sugar phosphate isomerase/epimerase
MVTTKPKVLLSTDTLPGYGLDHIFDIAKSHGFDGIDLAMWKNFDSWNNKYVKKLIKQYDLPVHIIQTSHAITPKELQQALILAQEVGASVLAFNAPAFFNIKSYKLISDGLEDWKAQFPDIQFTIITPNASSMALLPVFPKFRFSSIVEIIKRYKALVGLDTSHISEESRDTMVLRKMESIIPYISVVYASDKNAAGVEHMPLGEGILPVHTLLEQLYKH